MQNNWFRPLLRRRFLVALLIVFQVAFLIYVVMSYSNASKIVSAALTAVSVFAVLYIIMTPNKSSYKQIWIFQILLFPIFGGLFYLFFRFQSTPRQFYRRQVTLTELSRTALESTGRDALPEAVDKLPQYAPLIRYLQSFSGFPVYDRTATEYLSPGELFFERVIPELKKAEKYIFVEFFILRGGRLWDSILDILTEKAAAGVDVRVMYDDMGCFFTLPKGYRKELEKRGIKCLVFNAFRPVLSALQNNRDHRKIISIDGKVAFTGGINLADEYANFEQRLGHWKDCSILVKGDAAWSLTLIFLQLWDMCLKIAEDFSAFYPDKSAPHAESDGYVQPYADSPLDSEHVVEHIYVHIINSAKRYLYITTPYLILDDTLTSALSLAAKSGVDVRIITPYIADKKPVHFTTRSYYPRLIEAGVGIYEYSLGFIHSKTLVADDAIASVGTANLDFRSLYLQFECGVCLYGAQSVKALKTDFEKTLPSCKKISLADCKTGFFARLFQGVMRLFAPLM